MLLKSTLIETTALFFTHYWNENLNGHHPEWSKEHWYFKGTIPGNDKSGCYALFKGEELIYIGVGIAKGGGVYENCGLGDRLKRYYKRVVQGEYVHALDWEVDNIATIAFDPKHYYLAAALEIYLIDKLKPAKNKAHK
jgi:hypothetical protein